MLFAGIKKGRVPVEGRGRYSKFVRLLLEPIFRAIRRPASPKMGSGK